MGGMRKYTTYIVSVLVLVLMPLRAHAGATSDKPVYVGWNPASQVWWAFGTLSSARHSDNTVEYLGCYWQYISSASTPYESVWCWAKNAAGSTIVCSIDDDSPHFTAVAKVIRALTSDSYLEFEVAENWDDCADVKVGTLSSYVH